MLMYSVYNYFNILSFRCLHVFPSKAEFVVVQCVHISSDRQPHTLHKICLPWFMLIVTCRHGWLKCKRIHNAFNCHSKFPFVLLSFPLKLPLHFVLTDVSMLICMLRVYSICIIQVHVIINMPWLYEFHYILYFIVIFFLWYYLIVMTSASSSTGIDQWKDFRFSLVSESKIHS